MCRPAAVIVCVAIFAEVKKQNKNKPSKKNSGLEDMAHMEVSKTLGSYVLQMVQQ